MTMFHRMTVPALEAAIDSLKAQLASGIERVQNPIVGGGKNISVDQAERILGQLYDRLEEKTGTVLRAQNGLVIVNVSARRGAV